ncbi:MAG: pentapeptide repeat-containing protein, partial [Hyphomicrobiaceae bacterium]
GSEADLSRADVSRADLSRADLSRADLSEANLSEADLSRANLSGADLSEANLSEADLSRADLSGAKTKEIQMDLYRILDSAKAEVPGLYRALLDGKINGRVYKGECACLVGTIANIRGINYENLEGLTPDASRPAEKWFLAIKQGDTPENNPISALTAQWLEAFMKESEIQIPKREAKWS